MTNYIEVNYENNMKMLSQAEKYCEYSFSHQDIINELSLDNDLKKQICIIELNKIENQKEADILINNLTGQSGPIRETTSYKILELISQPKYSKFFQTEKIINIFTKAITDINPSVSRNTVEIIKYVKNSQLLYESIINEILITLANIDETTKNRSYVQNKKNFNLYWNLEALVSISNNVEPDYRLNEILVKCAKSNDYTIREKTAKTARTYISHNGDFQKIIDLIKNDENIYVRRYID